MFCPKCATQNLEGASFCRSCGANISLVSQALTGQMTEEPLQHLESRIESRRRRRNSRPPNVGDGIAHAFMGLGFLAISLALALFGGDMGAGTWWFFMLIPAFIFLGKGIGEIVQAKQSKTLPPAPASLSAISSPPQNATSLPPRPTAELVPAPPSITEGTTRHLGAEAPTRHLDSDQN